MKVRTIINAINTYNSYNAKINICIKKKNEHDAWDDEKGVMEMEKQINNLKEDLGKFLDTEI